MDSEPDRELEVIKSEMDATKSSLAEKIGALETQASEAIAGVTGAVTAVTDTVSSVTEKVTGTVQSLSESVSGTVSNLTESVSNTVASVGNTVTSVRDTLDFTPTVRAHPWASVGCAVAAGMIGGFLLSSPRPGRSSRVSNLLGLGRAEGVPPPAEPRSYFTPSAAPAPAANGHHAEPTALGAVSDTVGDLAGTLRSYGISALMGLVANLAKDAVPESIRGDVTGALDRLKTKLGGHHSVNPEFTNK